MPVNDSRLILLSDGLWYNDQQVDVFTADAAARLRALLGPAQGSYRFPGTGRTAELFGSGTILLVEDEQDVLLSLMVCLDSEQGSPYQAFLNPPVFGGTIEAGGHRFTAGESEQKLRAMPGIKGVSGALSVDVGRLHVGFILKAKKDVGEAAFKDRRLVQLSAEWGGIKGFKQNSTAS